MRFTAMTTTSPAPPASRPVIPNRLTGLHRHTPMVILFVAVSPIGRSVDYALVPILNLLTGPVLCAVVGARIVPYTLGFPLNRRLFGVSLKNYWRPVGGYVTVQGGVAAMSYAGIAVLTGTGAPLWPTRVPVDSTLFIINYLAQFRLVYHAPAQQPVLVSALATAA